MKSITILILSTLISFSAKGQTEFSQNIKGHISNMNDSLLVYLVKLDLKNWSLKVIDSTYTTDEKFEFNVNIQDHGEFAIEIQDQINDISKAKNFWLGNNDITIKGEFEDFSTATVAGSPLNDLSLEYNEFESNQYNILRNEKNDSLGNANFLDVMFNYIYKMPQNILSLNKFLIFVDKFEMDSVKLYYAQLHDEVKMSQYGIDLYNYIHADRVKVGNKYSDISAKDVNGKKINLSDFEGKVILLDFWASWCGPCHELNKNELPRLIKKYNKEEFVIVSYALDTDRDTWLRSSESDKIDWVNISNLKGVDDIVAIQYDINFYPTTFIIDKNGVIVDKGYWNPNELESKLDNILLKSNQKVKE